MKIHAFLSLDFGFGWCSSKCSPHNKVRISHCEIYLVRECVATIKEHKLHRNKICFAVIGYSVRILLDFLSKQWPFVCVKLLQILFIQ